MRGIRLTLGAMALSGVALAIDRTGALGWPRFAGQTLAGLFALVGITRLLPLMTQRSHAPARAGVVGIAATGAAWFGGAAIMTGDWSLAGLALAHAAVVGLGLVRAPVDPQGLRRLPIVASASMVLSLLAVAALPAALRPSSVWVPSLMASGVVIGAYGLARRLEWVRVPLGALAVVAVTYAARTLAMWDAPAPPPVLRLAAITLAAAAAPLVIDAARALPDLVRRRWPKLDPTWRNALVALPLPLVGLVSAALLASR